MNIFEDFYLTPYDVACMALFFSIVSLVTSCFSLIGVWRLY